MKHFFNFAINVLIILALFSGSIGVSQTLLTSPNGETEKANDILQEAHELGLKWDRQSTAEAIEIYQAEAERRKNSNDKQISAGCLREAARLHQILGDKEIAEAILKKALDLVGSGQYVAEESKIYSDLSTLALESGQISQSREYFEKAILLAQKSGDISALAAAQFSAGDFYYFRNEVQNSLEAFKKSLELWRRARDWRGEAKSLLNLGYLYLKQSDFDAGLETLNIAFAKYQDAKDSRGAAITLKAIGFVLDVMDEKQKALETLLKAEHLFPEDIDYAEKASLFNSIGHIYENYEEWQLSLNYREKAFDLYKKENHLYGQLATLPSLGKSSDLIGDKPSALKYFTEAEALARKLHDDFYLAISKSLLGDLYFKSGEYQIALKTYQESLGLFKENVHQKYIAQTLNKLGQIREKQNEFELARENFQSSLELSRKVSDKFGEADTLYHLAKLNATEGNDKEALIQAEKSVETTENLYTDVVNSKLKSTYFSNVYDRYELFIGLLMKMNGRFPGQGFDVYALQASDRARSRSMLETLRLTEASFTKDADPEIVKREKEIRSLLNVKADSLTDLLSRNSDPTEIQKVSNDINELTHELEKIRANLKQNSPVYSAIQNPSPFDVSELQNQILDEKTMLFEFSFGEKESYLWVIEKTGFSSFVLPSRERIETTIQRLRQLLDSREMTENETVADYQARTAAAEKLYWLEAQALSNDLFGQVAERFGSKRLIIVPDGKLHYFPVAALPFPNSATNEPILLTNEVIYEPSASTLLILARNEKQPLIQKKDLLVFADPVFSADDSRLAHGNKFEQTDDSAALNNFRFAESLNSLLRLPASKDESETIRDIVGASNSDIFSGFSANREQLLNFDVSKYKIIHLATHGLIDENRPELSGVILSRFDQSGQKQNEFVRLHDIYGMNLSANLVVLSACSTGIGKEIRGEGLQSLNNAFLQVGAKTVMSSLWKVDDYATLELMKNFYALMADENLTPSQALRSAKIKMRQNPRFNSPFYWAAFTVQGDFRRTPDLSGNWNFKAHYLILLLPIVLFGIWVWFKRRNLQIKL